MIRSYTMMKTGSTTGTVCHQGKRIKPDHGPTPEDHDPRKLPLGRGSPCPGGVAAAEKDGQLDGAAQREVDELWQHRVALGPWSGIGGLSTESRIDVNPQLTADV